MKSGFVLLLILLLSGFAVAQKEPTIGIGGEGDVEEAKGLIEDYSPLDESGKVDYGKYQPFVTKAEVRIAEINLWLDENVGWMRYIFHMKPEVSIFFFIYIYVILWFSVLLFFNAEGLWFFIEEGRSAKIFGASAFFVFMIVKLYYGITSLIHSWLSYAWFVLLDISIWALLIGLAIFGACLWFGWASLSTIGVALGKYKERRDIARRAMKMDAGIEAVDAMINQVGKK